MNPRTTLLSLLLLIVTVSVSAQNLPTGSENAQAGPLNLFAQKGSARQSTSKRGREDGWHGRRSVRSGRGQWQKE